MPIWLKAVTGVVALVLVAAIAFAGFWFIRLQGNISKAPLNAGGESTEAPGNDATGRLQILILGSDTRDGKNSEYGTADDSTGYGKSDVMMLMDISEDNKRVNVISFPRDLLVDIPDCKDRKTKTDYPARTGVMINEAMSEAGIGCAVDTVNKLTGMQVDHFMMADFNAVKELSNAVGEWTSASATPFTIRIPACGCPPERHPSREKWLLPSSEPATRMPTAATWAGSRPSRASCPR